MKDSQGRTECVGTPSKGLFFFNLLFFKMNISAVLEFCLDILKPNTLCLSLRQLQLCGKGFFWTSKHCIFLTEEARQKGLLPPGWDFVVVVVGGFFSLLA